MTSRVPSNGYTVSQNQPDQSLQIEARTPDSLEGRLSTYHLYFNIVIRVQYVNVDETPF